MTEKLHFKNQVRIDGVLYKKGLQHVEANKLEHPHFVKYMKAGYIAKPAAKKKLEAREEPEIAKVIRRQQEEAKTARARKVAEEAAKASGAASNEETANEQGPVMAEYEPTIGEDVSAEDSVADEEKPRNGKKSRR